DDAADAFEPMQVPRLGAGRGFPLRPDEDDLVARLLVAELAVLEHLLDLGRGIGRRGCCARLARRNEREAERERGTRGGGLEPLGELAEAQLDVPALEVRAPLQVE